MTDTLTFIRSSKHTLKFLNTQKSVSLSSFIKEYRRVANLYCSYIWNSQIKVNDKKGKNSKCFNLQKHQYDLNSYLSNVEIDKAIKLETFLSGRALKCCLTQVLGVVKGTLEKRKKTQYIINKKRKLKQKVSSRLRKLVRSQIRQPDCSQINPELNSICFDIEIDKTKEFDAFVSLKSVVSDKRNFTINIPVLFHSQSNKWKEKGTLMNSILLSDDFVSLRWEVPLENVKEKGVVAGGDQGIKTVLTLSDKQTTPLENKDGYSLEKIQQKLCRKKKGSKGFEKTSQHRTNFINWSINQLDFSKIKKLNLEKLKDIGRGKNRGRFLTHWSYKKIEDKLARKCEEEKVSLQLDDNVFYSQRCSNCGLVLKSNRKAKEYFCRNCGFKEDSDLNASFNHQQELVELPFFLRKSKKNRKGFFWKSNGFFELTGEEITVPLSKK